MDSILKNNFFEKDGIEKIDNKIKIIAKIIKSYLHIIKVRNKSKIVQRRKRLFW